MYCHINEVANTLIHDCDVRDVMKIDGKLYIGEMSIT